MKLTQWIQLIIIGSCVLTITSCHTAKKYFNSNDNAVNEANSAYSQNTTDDAQSMAAGEETQQYDEQNPAAAPAAIEEKQLAKRTYYFDFDSNVVREDDKPAIVANADYLIAHPNDKIMLEGHTDPRGSREYNIGLGERRAKSVAEILTAKGVNPSQIRIVSYGAEKLAVAGRTEPDFQLDRRVMLVLLQS